MQACRSNCWHATVHSGPGMLVLMLGLWCQQHTEEQRPSYQPLGCNNHSTQDMLASQQVHTSHRLCSRQKVQHAWVHALFTNLMASMLIWASSSPSRQAH